MKNWKERKQVIVDLMKNEFYVPMKEKELAILLRVEPEDREELSNVLKSLLEKRKIHADHFLRKYITTFQAVR